jgi:hypothetical protein
LFGNGVGEIRRAFLNLHDQALDKLLTDYGSIYSGGAEAYARKTFPMWKSGATNLSGQTMERLVELVPPYLSPDQRFAILKMVLDQHKQPGASRTLQINVKEPAVGFAELDKALSSMAVDNNLAHLPEAVMAAAKWLWDDDITSARAMLAEVDRRTNEVIRASAIREIQLLRQTISSGQVKAASYSVTMPSGKLSVVAYSPSECFVATVCFGQDADATRVLRQWRDRYLMERQWGKEFIVWYYRNGETISRVLSSSPTLISCVRIGLTHFVKHVRKPLLSERIHER